MTRKTVGEGLGPKLWKGKTSSLLVFKNRTRIVFRWLFIEVPHSCHHFVTVVCFWNSSLEMNLDAEDACFCKWYSAISKIVIKVSLVWWLLAGYLKWMKNVFGFSGKNLIYKKRKRKRVFQSEFTESQNLVIFRVRFRDGWRVFLLSCGSKIVFFRDCSSLCLFFGVVWLGFLLDFFWKLSRV